MPGDLGQRLRELRLQKGLTLQELAAKIGKSESYLSKLEHGKINPSLTSLKKIADALGRPVVHLFEDDLAAVQTVLADGQRRRIIVSPHLEYEILSAPNAQVALFKVRLKKGGSSGAQAYIHEGIECGLILSGKVRIVVGDKAYVLTAGQSITFRSEQPHRFENAGDEEAVGIWAVSPPTF
ncbi:MAG: helix-turn-helix domain-containing protein [Candidatus Acetothermia bacterium]|jgi:transcriptional regulator with XRE-family HTH domain|nr:helix-turn-helix domain-containing protein [Candidatus Acetothermia bacterium]